MLLLIPEGVWALASDMSAVANSEPYPSLGFGCDPLVRYNRINRVLMFGA